MASRPPVQAQHVALGFGAAVLIGLIVFGGSFLLTAGSSQKPPPAAELVAVSAPGQVADITLQPGQSVTIHAAAAATATPGSTVIPSPSATSAVPPPTGTPTVALSPTVGVSPTPFLGAFALGIRLDKGDPATLAGWNLHALPMDGEHSEGANAALLLSAKGTDRQVSCGGAAVLADSCQAAINYALAAGIKDLNVNDEGPPCATLVADELRVYQKIHAAGLTMMWAPTGVMLRACPANSFTTNTDRIMFQVEALEQDPTVDFPKTVHDEIAALHAVRGDVPIAVQVSVNPPHNRTATAAQVLADIAALEDGSANAPVRVDIFYSARTTTPGRADVMLQVQAALRP